MKIVSLLPAATEIVSALGLLDCLVGRSHECDFPEEVLDVPPLTRSRLDTSLPSETLDREVRRIVEQRLPIYVLDDERLAALRPDVVVTQEACEVCAVAKEQVVGSLRRTACDASVVSLLPTRLDHVFEDVVSVARACGIEGRGERLAAELRGRMRAPMAAGTRQRVAVVEWLAPPMLAGHWVPEAIEAAGGLALGPGPGERSIDVSWEEIRALQPDAVVVAPCGCDLARTIHESRPWTEMLRSLAPRVLLLDGNAYLNRPGPRIVDAIEMLAGWLRGEPVPVGRGADLQSGTE